MSFPRSRSILAALFGLGYEHLSELVKVQS